MTAWIALRDRGRVAATAAALVEEDGEDRAFTLLTTLDELKGYEEPRGTPPARWAPSTAPSKRPDELDASAGSEEAESLGSTDAALRRW